MQGEAPDQVNQVCAVQSGVLGSLLAGGVGTMQASNLWGVGHARPRCRRQGRACSALTGWQASWACAIGGRALPAGGRAYSSGGGACRESDGRLPGSGRGGAGRGPGRGLEWPEVARLLGRKRRSPSHRVPGMASPRELTQNPLKKIWMPYSNGRPALHACQRGGEAGSVENRGVVHGMGG